jgi:hypothetical protein
VIQPKTCDGKIVDVFAKSLLSETREEYIVMKKIDVKRIAVKKIDCIFNHLLLKT